MGGRTEKVNARDQMDRADGVYFEGDVVRTWISQLRRRAQLVQKGIKGRFEGEITQEERVELDCAVRALTRAESQLEIFAAAVAKRSGEASNG